MTYVALYFLFAFVQAILCARAMKEMDDPVMLVSVLVIVAPLLTVGLVLASISAVIHVLVTGGLK